MIKKLLISSGAVIATVALSGSLAFASGISNTGHKSVNVIANVNKQTCTSVNTNNVKGSNTTQQTSLTGNAKVKNNTTGGDATTGDSTNSNTTKATLNLTNTGSCDGLVVSAPVVGSDDSIDTTGSKSLNVIANVNVSSSTTVNSNSLWVGNVTLQGSQSGGASVSDNTTGGNATSGNSGSTNSSTFTFTLSNN